jgi:hypothetical protein
MLRSLRQSLIGHSLTEVIAMPKYTAIILSLLILGSASVQAYTAAHPHHCDLLNLADKGGDKGDDDGGDDDGDGGE